MHEFILHLGFLLTLEFKQPSYLTVYIKALDEKCVFDMKIDTNELM